MPSANALGLPSVVDQRMRHNMVHVSMAYGLRICRCTPTERGLHFKFDAKRVELAAAIFFLRLGSSPLGSRITSSLVACFKIIILARGDLSHLARCYLIGQPCFVAIMRR